MDDDGKCWLLECNNSPGLEYCNSHFTEYTEKNPEWKYAGASNPDEVENDDPTWEILDDRMAVLGFDRDVTSRGNEEHFVRVC